MPRISKSVGIDLGTTNSVISMIGEDNETIICRQDRAGRKTFPSVVVYDAAKGLIAGQRAFNRRGTVPEPIVSIKSHMGDASYRAVTGPRELSPIEVSTEVLRTMKEEMEAYLHAQPGYEDYVVDRAVVTIPAYFRADAREATANACEKAGMKCEFTLQEPTAAALYYCHKNHIDTGTFMVYDLGGGTFDVSIVKVDYGEAYVYGIAGNNYLGGDNFDTALAKFILDQLKDLDEGYELDLDPNHNEEDARRMTKLKLRAEIIKKALSTEDEVYEILNGVFQDKSGMMVNGAVTITRANFEELIRPMLDSTLHECWNALAEAEKQGVTLDQIDAVLLVGGSTHIPLVTQVITETFTDPSLEHHTKQAKPLIDEPDMAVGYGAAFAASSLPVISGDAKPVEAGAVSYAASFDPGTDDYGTSVVRGTLICTGGTLPADIKAKVSRANGGCEKEFNVAPDGAFTFDGLVYEDAQNDYYACVFSSGGKELLATRFDASTGRPPAPPVVLARDYSIKIHNPLTDADELFPLMTHGTRLPATGEYVFHVSNGAFADFMIYEERDELRKVPMVFDPPVAPGTEIRFLLSCDKSSRFHARAEVSGNIMEFDFEQLPVKPMPTHDEIERQIAVKRDENEQIPEAGRRRIAQRALDNLERQIWEAYDAGDNQMVWDLLAMLITGPGSFVPPMSEEAFDALVQEVRDAQNQSDKYRGNAQITEAINRARERGKQGYSSRDREAIGEAIKKLRDIKEQIEDHDGPKPEHWKVGVAAGIGAVGQREFGAGNDIGKIKEALKLLEERPFLHYPGWEKEAAEDSRKVHDNLNVLMAYQTDNEVTKPRADGNIEIFIKWRDRVDAIKNGLPTK